MLFGGTLAIAASARPYSDICRFVQKGRISHVGVEIHVCPAGNQFLFKHSEPPRDMALWRITGASAAKARLPRSGAMARSARLPRL
jgi:hypothetical protein